MKFLNTLRFSENLKKQGNHINLSANQVGKQGNIDLPGYPLYPAGEDIFRKYKEEGNIIPKLLHKMDPIGVLLTICWSASGMYGQDRCGTLISALTRKVIAFESDE
jgi:hypothetical protein